MKIAKNFKIKTAQGLDPQYNTGTDPHIPDRPLTENGEIDLSREYQRDLNLMNQNMESNDALIAYAEDQELANEYVNILKIENIPSSIKVMNNKIGLFVPEIYIDEALEIIDNHSPDYENEYQGYSNEMY